MDNEPPQKALFDIMGPDEDGCVWIYSPGGREVWGHNLGPSDKVAAKLTAWLAAIDYQGQP